jgi:hypothetical protein
MTSCLCPSLRRQPANLASPVLSRNIRDYCKEWPPATIPVWGGGQPTRLLSYYQELLKFIVRNDLLPSIQFEEAASQLGFSRIIKNVPKKLTKEKGQFLAPFIGA